MQAIVSDVHSNLEAFQAVMEDLKQRGIADIICLGDLVGYGPNPRECLDMAKGFRLCLLGNHEEAVLFEAQAQGFNPRATSAVRWTARQFDMLGADRQGNAQRWDFMGNMQRYYSGNGILLVHGSPSDPTREYIYTTDVRNPNKMERIFSQIEHLCFVGHTHVPGIWTEDMTYRSPEDLDYVYRITPSKTIINVGSIGQPRDNDPRACYALFDGTMVQFVKVKYDLETTVRKIYAIEDLDRSLGDRLREGR
jgi:diadenosine tetraphosphatase ApaH/serine/threonine PP2A family protein phosphatase